MKSIWWRAACFLILLTLSTGALVAAGLNEESGQSGRVRSGLVSPG